MILGVKKGGVSDYTRDGRISTQGKEREEEDAKKCICNNAASGYNNHLYTEHHVNSV
jgi:hypothetical protein